MNSAINQVPEAFAAEAETLAANEEIVRSRICSVLSMFQPQPVPVERRSDQRYPFPYLVHLTPVDKNGLPEADKTIVVVGKQVSERGFGFYHTKPLPYRRMIVTFDAGRGARFSFLIDLTWCRFTKQGWYESGGRFLHAVATPKL